jgi:hypothetical protein
VVDLTELLLLGEDLVQENANLIEIEGHILFGEQIEAEEEEEEVVVVVIIAVDRMDEHGRNINVILEKVALNSINRIVETM